MVNLRICFKLCFIIGPNSTAAPTKLEFKLRMKMRTLISAYNIERKKEKGYKERDKIFKKGTKQRQPWRGRTWWHHT